MKEKGATFFLFLLFIIMQGFNKTRKIVGEDLNGIWKEWTSRILEVFRNEFQLFYSSHQCHIIHNNFPTDIGNDTVIMILKFVIVTDLIRSQNPMAVIFLMVELWVFVPTFCHIQKTAIRTRLV